MRGRTKRRAVCLVRTGWAADPLVEAEAAADASVVADSIVEAVDWILIERR